MKEIVDKYLGSHHAVESGDQYKYHCPICHHKNPNLSVNYNKDVFKCWVCGFSGRSILNLLYGVNAHPSDIERVKKYLGRSSMFDKKSSSISDLQRVVRQKLSGEENNKKYIPTPSSWSPVWNYKDDIFKIRAYKYLKSRKLSPYEIKLYNIQFDEDKLCISIPSYDREGKLNFYVDHYFETSFYQNPSGFSKMDIIFNEYHIDFKQEVIITEGTYDAFNIGHNTVPLLGTFIPKGLIQRFIEFETPCVNIFLDGDAKDQSKKISKYLDYYGIPNIIIDVESGEDGNSLDRKDIISYLNIEKDISFETKIKKLIGD